MAVTNKVAIKAYIDPRDAEALRQIAISEERSQTSLVRRAVREFLERYKHDRG